MFIGGVYNLKTYLNFLQTQAQNSDLCEHNLKPK